MGVLLVGSSRRPLIELQGRIISTAMLVGGLGILIAILASLWFAARVTRPVVSLAEAARRVAAGDLSAKVEVESTRRTGRTRRLLQPHDRRFAPRKRSHRASRARSRLARTGAPPCPRIEESAYSLCKSRSRTCCAPKKSLPKYSRKFSARARPPCWPKSTI